MPGMPGPRTPSANALSDESVGLGQQDRPERVQAAEDERSARARRAVGGVAAVEGDAELVLAVDREVHDDRLDEDLAARLIEPVDDRAQVARSRAGST